MRTTEKPTWQNFHIEGVMHILPMDALQAIEKGGISLWKAHGLPIESNIAVGGCACKAQFPKTGFKKL